MNCPQNILSQPIPADRWAKWRLKWKRWQLKRRLPRGSRITRRVTMGTGSKAIGPIMIKGAGWCHIGKYCAIGNDVKMITSNHKTNLPNLQMHLQGAIGGISLTSDTKQGITIEHNVWIGDSVIILAGVTVGSGAVLAAGAVVTKDVAPFSIVGGSPARELKKRFSEEVISELQRIEWWNWPHDRILRNRDFFNLDLSNLKTMPLDRHIQP